MPTESLGMLMPRLFGLPFALDLRFKKGGEPPSLCVAAMITMAYSVVLKYTLYKYWSITMKQYVGR